MERSLQPELLDRLDPREPAAIQSRRDLRRIDAIMGNSRWLDHRLAQLVRPGERILELGAGEGARVNRGGQSWDGLDLCPRPAHWPPGSAWHRQDVREFTEWSGYPVLFCSLFLHHFSGEELARLGENLRAHARVVIAAEPLRSRVFQGLFAALCPLIGAGAVTRHDGHVSIAAGFRGDELPRQLGFVTAEWQCRQQATLFGAYHFAAVRA